MRKHFKYLEQKLNELPSKIKILKITLDEMNKGTGPDKYADYHDEK
jgi:hypothetical protein